MKTRRLLACLCLAVLSIGGALPALALANRVFVSARSGNDANACDNINTPCQTFAGAVVQLNPGGEAIVLDSGGYGPVTITKSLTIEAPSGVLAFVHPPSGAAITINAGVADVVVLRGLVLNGGASYGIGVSAAGSVHIENCVISGFLNGIGVSQSVNNKLFVSDTTIRSCGAAAIVITSNTGGTSQVNVDRCRLEDSSRGIEIQDGSKVSVRNTVASGNSELGMIAFFSGQLEVENCQVTNGNSGIIGGGFGSPLVRVSNSTITSNGIGLSNQGGGVVASRSNNTIQENGIDLSGSVTIYGAK